jgi:hypothetical protein
MIAPIGTSKAERGRSERRARRRFQAMSIAGA